MAKSTQSKSYQIWPLNIPDLTLAEVMIVPLDGVNLLLLMIIPHIPQLMYADLQPMVLDVFQQPSLYMVQIILKFVEKQEVTKGTHLMHLLYFVATRVLIVLMLMGYP